MLSSGWFFIANISLAGTGFHVFFNLIIVNYDDGLLWDNISDASDDKTGAESSSG
jgi:hypothetical protein